jgi:hypothetical protein
MLMEILAMFPRGTTIAVFIEPAHEKATGCPRMRVLAASLLLLALTAPFALAQHGGGGGGGRGIGGGGISAGPGRPDGVDEKDDLKTFHEALAVQATPEQQAAFVKITHYAESAGAELKAFLLTVQKQSPALSSHAAALDQAVEQARAGSQNFLTSFSDKQKSALKEATRKLERADVELDRQVKALDQTLQATPSEPYRISKAAEGAQKALADFQNEQLALGRDMSILLPSDSQGLAFNLPKVTNSVEIDGQSVSIPATGSMTRQNVAGQNIFDLRMTADLSDLQQNIRPLLRAALTHMPRCGQRVAVQEASFTPLAPAGLVVLNLHLERWACPPGFGQSDPTEVALDEETVEIKLTATVDQNKALSLASEITRVSGGSFFRDALRSGDLGSQLRERTASAILSVLQKGTDWKTLLPPTVQANANLEDVQFQDAGADQLGIVVNAQLPLTDEQAKSLSPRPQTRLAAQGSSTQQ